MKAIKRTPRSEMQAKSLWRRAPAIAATLAEALEAPKEDVETELNTFIYLSVNVEFEVNEIDWNPTCAADDDATIAAKFLKYMNADVEPIDRASALIIGRDRPVDEATAPTLTGETEKNS